jgi:SWI/SNF-related matrix-associated actin-dependent regulator of chromatin subfamily D
VQRFKTLRIWISNTVEDQFWQTGGLNIDGFDYAGNLESSYRVKIEGRLLNDEDETDREEDEEEESKADQNETQGDKMETDSPSKTKPKAAPPKHGQRPRLSHFFKALTVDFERPRNGRQTVETSVEWKKPDRTPAGSVNLPAMADFDEITFKRNGDENTDITINLFRHEEPERFELSNELAEVIDMREATRQEAVMALWEYIKLMRLQEDEEKRNFRCDELLKRVCIPPCSTLLLTHSSDKKINQVIGREAGYIPHLNDYITPHLKPLPPIKLAYTIRVDEEFHKNPQPTIYDVRVAVDDPLRSKLVPFIQNPQYAAMLKEVAVLDDQLATLVQAVAQSKAKHTFLTSMAKDPVGFVRAWLSSQKRDLDVIMGEATRGGTGGSGVAGEEGAAGDEWRKGGRGSVWNTPNARESVNVLLSKQPAPR